MMTEANQIAVDHINQSITQALLGESHFHEGVLDIPGFATATMRRLISNICHVPDITYLEVGTYCGATFAAAFSNNPITAYGIDNFKQDFGRPDVRQQLQLVLAAYSDGDCDVDFIEGDCFDSEIIEELGGDIIDIFYYDGEHDIESQADALPTYIHLLAKRFIFIVDDMNWEPVRTGTEEGFVRLGKQVKIIHEWHLKGEKHQDDPVWWNGMSIYLCENAP